MGLQINKILGYGITDFQGFDKDERINWEVVDLCINGCEKYNADNFKNYVYDYLKRTDWNELFGNLTWNFYFDERSSKRSDHFDNILKGLNSCDLLYSYMIHDIESNSSTFLFTNPINSSWQRHDDTIDYYEEDGTVGEKLKILPSGIYPYNSCFYDVRTKERTVSGLINAIKYLESQFTDPEELNEKVKEFIEKTSYSSYDEYKMYCGCVVPDEIQMYLDFIGLFNKDKFGPIVLKPMLYTYWS